MQCQCDDVAVKSDKKQYKILFLDAQDDVLLHRYKQTRRKHPLLEVTKGSIEEALHLERRLLNHVKARADYVIDTSLLAQLQLRFFRVFVAAVIDHRPLYVCERAGDDDVEEEQYEERYDEQKDHGPRAEP